MATMKINKGTGEPRDSNVSSVIGRVDIPTGCAGGDTRGYASSPRVAAPIREYSPNPSARYIYGVQAHSPLRRRYAMNYEYNRIWTFHSRSLQE